MHQVLYYDRPLLGQVLSYRLNKSKLDFNSKKMLFRLGMKVILLSLSLLAPERFEKF
jgi:hypothetical protein